MRGRVETSGRGLEPAGVFRRLATAAPVRVFVVFAMNAVYWSLPLLAGLVMSRFFDLLSGSAPGGPSLRTLTALYLAVRAGRGLWWVAAGALSEYHLAVSAFLLRRNLFNRVLHRPSYRMPVGSGEFVNRFRDDAEAVSHPIFYATVGSGQLVSACATLWVLLRIDVLLTVVVFLMPLLSYGIMRVFGPSIERSYLAARESSEHTSGFLTELLANVLALQAGGAESAAVDRLEGLNQVRGQTASRSALISASAAALNTAVVGIAVGLILLMTAIRSTQLTIGELVLFSSYVGFGDGVVAEIAEWAGDMMRSLRQAGVSVNRLKELVSEEDHAALVDTTSPTLRKRRGIGVTAEPPRDGELRELTIRGLTGIDLSVRRGELVVVTGRIASGKTLLLETLLGLSGHRSGEVRWNGRRVDCPESWFVPPRCAYVPQAPRVFSETVRENILLGLDADDATLRRAMRMAVLEGDVARLEHGLDSRVGPRGVKLSGGQVQRVAAARAFVRDPELLVLDDLSSALDVETERTMWDRLLAEDRRPTCLVVSHRRMILERADRVVVLRDSRIEDQGSLQDLLERSAEMRQIWESQGHPGAPPDSTHGAPR